MTLERVSSTIELEVAGRWRREPDGLERLRKTLPEGHVDFRSAGSEVGQVFAEASPHLQGSEAEIEAIQEHRSRLVIELPCHRGDVELAARAMQAVRTLLEDRQALGVWVRSSGKAHVAREWRAFRFQQPFDLLQAYVVLGARDRFRSWGMKNFGLPDVILDGQPWPQMATALLQAFCVDRIVHSRRDPPDRYRLAEGLEELPVRWAMADPGDNPFGHHVLGPAAPTGQERHPR